MNWNEYVSLANRTAKPLPYTEQLMHSRLGVSTEIGELLDCYKRCWIYGKELDKTHVMEEIGDICWYVALECMNCHSDALDFNLQSQLDIVQFQATTETRVLAAAIGKLGGVFWESPKPANCIAVILACRELCRVEGIDFERCLRNNIAKLAARYGDKYSDNAALVRDLIAERNTLEA